jgi:glycosyltransferase involved in cell wall biosynthesis
VTYPAYTIITPVRNEAQYLQKTIASVAAQTAAPQRWVLVDDGSTDETAQIIEAAAKLYPWIAVLRREDRGFRKAGGGVIDAFYDGYGSLGTGTWDFLVKLDGDLSFQPDYFAGCLQHFQMDPKLGIGGGTICNEIDGELVEESQGDPPFHVRGATKIYRRECWQDIGGLIHAPGWDTLDELKANMLGWKTYSFSELKLSHHRVAGEADGAWKNWVKNGRANYITGYHPLFMLVKCAKRLFERPYGLAALGLFSGFFSGYLKRVPRVEDEALVRYLRREQINRLLFRQSLWDMTLSHPQTGITPAGSPVSQKWS